MNLYHYTRIETLSKILESKKIRFTSLLNVDDSEEKWSSDLFDHGKHIFVACFTAKEKESIEMWNMHKGNGEGVRLKFDKDVINKFTKIHDRDGDKYIVHCKGELYQIEYTDDQEKIYPKILKDSNIGDGIHLPLLGKYKNTFWDFQEEWRYSLIVYIYYVIEGKEYVDLKSIPCEYYDVEINKEALYNMEITLGYNVNENEAENVRALINEYNKENNTKITVKNSVLKGKVS